MSDPPKTALPGDRLTVCVIVPGTSAAETSPQAVRVLDGLLGDPRFEVQVFGAPAVDRTTPLPQALRMGLAAEQRLVPAPVRNPLPVLPDIPFVSLKDWQGADVVVDLAGGRSAPEGAAHGVWSIEDVPGHGPLLAGLSGAPHTEVMLVRRAGADARVIARAVYDTKPLASHSLDYAQEKAAQVVLRELARLQRDGQPADLGPVPGSQPAVWPSAARYALRSVARGAGRFRDGMAARRGRYAQAFGLRLGRGDAGTFDPAATAEVPMGDGVLWADPFLIAHEGETWCFFEDVDPAVGHGHISVGRVTETGLADVRPALRQPHHMSFPFVFHHAGDLLMMPEVHAAGRLEIWRCTRFPDEWELFSTAFDGTSVADSVLFQHDETWWLFTHISRDRYGDHCSDLHVFRVDGPELTQVEPHRLNPVVTDAATARGGGRVHEVGGRLLRMSQDNAGRLYGHALNVMEITALDLDRYEERRLRHITPDFAPGLVGCHHMDAAAGWVVIDVRRA